MIYTSTVRVLPLVITLLTSPIAVSAGILDQVKQRGALRCGVNTELAGFAKSNSLGEYHGFDVDLCRAIATAIFKDYEAVEMVPISGAERFNALQAGLFDVLSRNTTWTLERNTSYGDYAGVNFYDGQGFMVPKRSGIRSALELDNVPICVGENTTSELNAADFFSVSDLRYRPVYYDDQSTAAVGYIKGECKALSTDRSALAALRTSFAQPDAHVVLPEVISKEPLGPVVAKNDSEWANVVRWTLNCMINAEELGVSSTNVDRPDTERTPAIRRLTGAEGNTGELLGLDKLWCKRIIQQIGNYGEVYEKHVGPNSPIGLTRGVNALWTDGGLIYAPPVR